MAMFPDDAMLDVDQIASLTKYAKGTIYNLASLNKLPFKPARDLGDRILVSIVEMAEYMDKTMLSSAAVKNDDEPLPVKKKVGRPRGTTKAQLEIRCFQSDLRTAIYKFEVKGILSGVRESAERMTMLADDSLSCAEKFSLAKTAQLHSVGAAEAQFEAIDLHLSIPRLDNSQDDSLSGGI